MELTRRGCLALGGGVCLWLGLGGIANACFPEVPPLPAVPIPGQDTIDLDHHVLSRLTFGVTPALRSLVSRIGLEAWIAQQLAAESTPDHAADAASRGCEVRDCATATLYEFHPEEVHRQLSSACFLRAHSAENQLYEVMVEFWNDHFNIDMGKNECAYLKADDERIVARAHALGSFPAMLRASLTSPGMLWYLDGRENQIAPGRAPNENHARELLELHTLGVHGGYSQDDVMAVARCLSGYSVRERHEFHLGRVDFDPRHHDDGEKRVLGQVLPALGGVRDLERLVAILVRHPATSIHIATKLCRRFIGDQPPESAVSLVAARFAASGGDIRACLETLFRTPEFRGDGPWALVRGSKFKRPFHYLVSALRATGARCTDAAPFLEHLGILGQSPYRCPTPDGYGDRREAWQDGLWWRWQVVDDLAHGRIAGLPSPLAGLRERCGGIAELGAHLLGRRLSALEHQVITDLDPTQALSVLLASPHFQRC